MVLQYKCPNCGSDMVFDSSSGALSCESCGRKDRVETFPKDFIRESGDRTSGGTGSFEREAVEYQCNNCGAVLLTDANTAATTCSFCGAGVILTNRLSGQLAPVKVIPFKISRQQAEEAFKKWTKKSPLTPKKFHSADRIKDLSGIYVPYWLYDLNSQGSATAACTKVSSYHQGDYIVTETKHYNVSRGVNLNYSKIPADASAKMDDKLMDRLEPYNYNDLKDFNTPYLSGYLAEKYSYDDKELFPRAKKRADQYTDNYIRDSIQGYSSVTITNKQLNTTQRKSYYTLLPIWLFIYDYDKKEYIFAMNGQTGKIVGKPPISSAKVAAWFFGVSVVTFALIQLILLIGGGF